MQYALLFAAVLFTMLLTACEGFRCAKGIVLDKDTHRLLDSTYIEVLTADRIVYTDTSGAFDVCNRMGGCVPHCKDILVRFSKKGYKTMERENPEDSVFYMERN